MNSDESRQQFQAALQRLRDAFADLVAAKEEQFEQVLKLGWSDEFEISEDFLAHLEQKSNRLFEDAGWTQNSVESTASAMESVELEERKRLYAMKLVWDKLRSEGVPIDKRPLHADVPQSVQFQFQADTDPTGKDMEWWKANERNFKSLD